MAADPFYKLWVFDRATTESQGTETWVELPIFQNLIFTRTLASGGSIQFDAPVNQAAYSLLSEDNYVRVTQKSASTAANALSNGVLVDDFEIWQVTDDRNNPKNVTVQGQTLEKALDNLQIPYHATWTGQTIHDIFWTGSDFNTAQTEGSTIDAGSSGVGVLSFLRAPVRSSDYVQAGTVDNDTTTLVSFTVENKSLLSALNDLCNQATGYIRARIGFTITGTGPYTAKDHVVIDFFEPGSTVLQRHGGGTGLQDTQAFPTASDHVLKLGVSAQHLQRVDDNVFHTDNVYVLGQGTGSFQNAGSSKDPSVVGLPMEKLFVEPQVTDNTQASNLAQQIHNVRTSPGSRFQVSTIGRGLYSSNFNAELGDVIGLVDTGNNNFYGRFVQYQYSQGSFRHDLSVSYLGYTTDQAIARILQSFENNVRHTQGTPNWTTIKSYTGVPDEDSANPNDAWSFTYVVGDQIRNAQKTVLFVNLGTEIEWNTDTSALGANTTILPSVDLGASVSTTSGSAIVTGSGTVPFTQYLHADDVVRFNADTTRYTIQSVDSDTQLTLTANYPSTLSGATLYVMAKGDVTTTDDPTTPSTATTTTSITHGVKQTGTVSVTGGSVNVTGSGTTFTSLAAGEMLRFDGDSQSQQYAIASITDDTHLTLTTAYPSGLAGADFYLMSNVPMSTNTTVTDNGSTVPVTTTVSDNGSTAATTTDLIQGTQQPGTVSITGGTNTVAGVGTTFTNLGVGNFLRFNGDSQSQQYEIASIQNNTSLTLTSTYPTSFSGKPFYLMHKVAVTTTTTDNGSTVDAVTTVADNGSTVSANTTTTDNGSTVDTVTDTVSGVTVTGGTASATNGSTNVTTSADFTSQISVGDVVRFDSDSTSYLVDAVTSTSLTLDRAYVGTTGSGKTVANHGQVKLADGSLSGSTTQSGGGSVGSISGSTSPGASASTSNTTPGTTSGNTNSGETNAVSPQAANASGSYNTGSGTHDQFWSRTMSANYVSGSVTARVDAGSTPVFLDLTNGVKTVETAVAANSYGSVTIAFLGGQTVSASVNSQNTTTASGSYQVYGSGVPDHSHAIDMTQGMQHLHPASASVNSHTHGSGSYVAQGVAASFDGTSVVSNTALHLAQKLASQSTSTPNLNLTSSTTATPNLNLTGNTTTTPNLNLDSQTKGYLELNQDAVSQTTLNLILDALSNATPNLNLNATSTTTGHVELNQEAISQTALNLYLKSHQDLRSKADAVSQVTGNATTSKTNTPPPSSADINVYYKNLDVATPAWNNIMTVTVYDNATKPTPIDLTSYLSGDIGGSNGAIKLTWNTANVTASLTGELKTYAEVFSV